MSEGVPFSTRHTFISHLRFKEELYREMARRLMLLKHTSRVVFDFPQFSKANSGIWRSHRDKVTLNNEKASEDMRSPGRLPLFPSLSFDRQVVLSLFPSSLISVVLGVPSSSTPSFKPPFVRVICESERSKTRTNGNQTSVILEREGGLYMELCERWFNYSAAMYLPISRLTFF